ncbi:hypothetical protein NDN08_004473 [Rhodosorus marinus]|uniref:C2H2-type domain-containing protein n=1 Tax=Rhodosorus marinus TaxID=101924 RepID=A0AAV8ULD3_9RHOD|nr:hypothetical protein NDN08_004473 [Rhodosorus marinus]
MLMTDWMSERTGKEGGLHRMSLSFLVGDDTEAGSGSPDEKEEKKKDEVATKKKAAIVHQCPVCQTVCKFKSEVLYHEYLHGLNNDLTICHECELGFTKMFTYRSHVKCVHEKVKRHYCKECGKGFYFGKGLRKHEIAMHTKPKQFICSSCGKTFAKNDQLQRHRQTVHGAGSSKDV